MLAVETTLPQAWKPITKAGTPDALRAGLLLAVLCFAPPVAAGEHKLAGPEIRAVLSGHEVSGSNDGGPWRQIFAGDGSTTHFQGTGQSGGFWDVRGHQYCSRWPPGDRWSCYDIARDADVIAFIAADGSRSVGRITP
jgi:hypothetical protein